MDKKWHSPHTSLDAVNEDGGGTKRFKEIKSEVADLKYHGELLIETEDDYEHDAKELEFFLKRMNLRHK